MVATAAVVGAVVATAAATVVVVTAVAASWQIDRHIPAWYARHRSMRWDIALHSRKRQFQLHSIQS